MSKIRNGSITSGTKQQIKGAEILVSPSGVASRTEFWACNTDDFLDLCPQIGTAHPTYDQLQVQGPIKAVENGLDPTYFTLRYEGFLPVGGDSSSPELQRPVYEWIGNETVEPIASHWDIDAQITEAESNGKSPLDAQGRFSGFVEGTIGTESFSLFGIETYYIGGGVWRKTYISNTAPDLSYDGFIAVPEGSYPVAIGLVGVGETGRNYRQRPTSYREVGSKFEVVREWELSQPGGWAEEFYTKPV